MLIRLRQILLITIAAMLGYAAGSGPVAEWVADLCNLARMSWYQERIDRGSAGKGTILLAGYFLGQGLFLLVRRLISTFEPWRAKHMDHLASWDASLRLGTRFGLHQYLKDCVRWASEDPSARTQTLGLFKIHGLGVLNDRLGTLETTRLLQRIAAEIRVASLPDDTSAFTRWLAYHFPRPLPRASRGEPPARYPARWSGATFAIAFRALDAVRAVTIVRDVAAWIRQELEASDLGGELSLSAVAVIGGAGTSGRGQLSIGARCLAAGETSALEVLVEPTDMRAEVIAQLEGVQVKETQMSQFSAEMAVAAPPERSLRARGAAWLRQWGAAIGCLVGAVLLLVLGGGKQPLKPNIPWPENLHEVQLVDAAGPHSVRLIRSVLMRQSSSNWAIGNATLIQGNVADGDFNQLQLRLSVTNQSSRRYYVSPYDFAVIDSTGQTLPIDPLRTLRMTDGLPGKWLASGETWTGTLVSARLKAPATGLTFEPDRLTRLELKAQQLP